MEVLKPEEVQQETGVTCVVGKILVHVGRVVRTIVAYTIGMSIFGIKTDVVLRWKDAQLN